MKAVVLCVITAACCLATPVWESIGPYSASCYVLDIAPSNDDIVYAFGSGGDWRHPIFMSTNGGNSWNKMGSIQNMLQYMCAVAIVHSNSDVLYACGLPMIMNDEYIYKSSNSGVDWTGLTVPADVRAVWDLITHPTSSSTIFGAGHIAHNSTVMCGFLKSTDAGTTWTDTILDPDSVTHGRAFCLTVDPSDPDVIFVGGHHTHGGPSHAVIYKSTDGGATFTDKSTGLGTGAVHDIVVHPVNSDTLFAGTNDGVYRSADGGDTWSLVYSVPPIFVLAISSDNPDVIYAYQGASDTMVRDIVVKSTDNGDSWSQTGPGIIGSGVGADWCYGLAARSDDANTVYVSTYSGFYKTTNAGSNWDESVDGMATPEWIAAIAVAPSLLTTVYVSGVDYLTDYRSDNNGTDWTRSDGGSYVGFGAVAVHTTNPDIAIGATGYS